MKKLSALFLGLLFAGSLFAQKINVVTEEYPPYNYTESGKVTGLATEVVEAILKKAGVDYHLTSYPWSRAYKMAQEEANTMIFSIGRSEQREKLFKWGDMIVPYDIYFFKLKERKDIVVKSLADAKKYKIGVVQDDVRAQFLVTEGFSASTGGPGYETTSKDESNIKKLDAKRIDLFPIDEAACSYLAKLNGIDFSKLERAYKIDKLSSGLYFAFSLKTPDAVVTKCKTALAEMKKDGSYQKIADKYLK